MGFGEKFEELKESFSDRINAFGRKKFFALVGGLIAIIALIVYFLFFTAPVVVEGEAFVSFRFVDEGGQPLQEISVKYFIGEEEFSVETDSQGEISFIVPSYSDVIVRVDAFSLEERNFRAFERNYFFEEGEFSEEVTLRESITFSRYKSIILNSRDGVLGEEDIIARFACTVAENSWQANNSVSNSVITTEVPDNCGNVSAEISSESYEPASIVFLAEEEEKVVTLSKKEIPPGEVRVSVFDDRGLLLTGNSLMVNLYGERGGEYSGFTGEFASADFEVAPDDYTVTVSDPNGDYGTPASVELHVEPNGDYSREFTVNRSIKGVITVTVIDRDNLHELEGAEVILKDADGRLYAREETDGNGVVEFSLSNLQAYSVSAKKEGGQGEGYFTSVEFSVSEEELVTNPEIEIGLERITSENSGRVKVLVFDEDGLPVKNAFVQFMVLGNEADGSMDYLLETSIPHNDKWTDANGVVEFVLGEHEEAIYPYVTKGFVESKQRDLAREISLLDETVYHTTLVIGDSVINLHAVNWETGEPILGASYEVYKFTGEKLVPGAKEISDGSDVLTLKAIGRVYFKVMHDDYTSIYSRPIQLYPNETFNITLELRPLYVGEEPRIDFYKLLDEGGAEVQAMHFNQEYSVLFRVLFPSGEGITKGGMHFRVGDSFTLENEPLKILGLGNEQVEAAGAVGIIRGRTFKEENAGEEGEEIVEGEAKWVNVLWDTEGRGRRRADTDYLEGEYIVSVQVMPVEVDVQLPMYYRSWGVASGDRYLRDPLDEELGEAEETDKHGLYANTKSILNFFEGGPLACPEGEEDFCWRKEHLRGHYPGTDFDLQFEYDAGGYNITNYSEYDFNFSIQNVSGQVFEDLLLVIESQNARGEADESLRVDDYTLTNANAREITPSGDVGVYKLEFDDFGDFTYSKEISFSLKFTPQETGAKKFKVTIVGDEQIRYDHEASFRVESENEMEINLIPEDFVLPAGIGEFVELEVRDSGDEYLLGDVLITAEFDLQDVSMNRFIGEYRIAEGEESIRIRIPGEDTGTRVILKAFKENYTEASKTVDIDERLISWEPGTLSYNLDAMSEAVDSDTLVFENRTGIEYMITRAELVNLNDFFGLLNIDGINRALDLALGPGLIVPPIGEEVLPPQELEVEISLTDPESDYVRNILLAEFADERNIAVLEGTLMLHLEQAIGFIESDEPVPVTITVGLGEVPEEGCTILVDGARAIGVERGISLDGWNQSLLGRNRAILEFDITNHCEINGDGQDLLGMRALLKQDSDIHGNLEFSISSSDPSAQPKSAMLSVGHEVDLEPYLLEYDTRYTGRMEYRPNTGTEGEISNFEIQLHGLIYSEGEEDGIGTVPVYPNPEGYHIHGRIHNINLDECIELPERVEFASNETDTEANKFTIKNKCLFTEVDIRLCYNEGVFDNCSGGTEEGKLELSTRSVPFEIEGPEEEGGEGTPREINVELRDGVIGEYGIKVEAKAGNQPFQEIGEIPVTITSSGEWLELAPRHSIIATTNVNGEDNVNLWNRAFVQNFKIRANGCDWEEYNGGHQMSNWERFATKAIISAVFLGGGLDVGLTAVLVIAGLDEIWPGFTEDVLRPIANALSFGLLDAWFGCDSDNKYNRGPFRDYVMKFGQQLVGSERWEASDFRSCELGLGYGGEDIDAYCNQCNTLEENYYEGSEVYEICTVCDGNTPLPEEEPEHIPTPIECPSPGTGKEIFANLSWHSEPEILGDPLPSGEGVAAFDSMVEIMALKVKNNNNDLNKPMYGLLTIAGSYDRIINDPILCECDDEPGWEDCFNHFHVGQDDDLGGCRDGHMLENVSDDWSMHLRFEPRIQEFDDPVGLDVQRCEDGIRTGGFTGEGAIPKVRFNWNWTGNGIEWNSCDASNEEYIYCDATQFSIMVSKRMQMLKEFLNANGNELNNSENCPEDWIENAELAEVDLYNEENNEVWLESGVGLKSLTLSRELNVITATAYAKNFTEIDYDLNVEFIFKNTETNEIETTTRLLQIEGKGEDDEFSEGERSVVFEASDEGIYLAAARIIAPTGRATSQEGTPTAMIMYLAEGIEEECWLDYSTRIMGSGKPGIEFFLNHTLPSTIGDAVNISEDEIDWDIALWNELAPGWEGTGTFRERMDFLRSLILFDAYLIKDAYSEDFLEDFANHTSFVDAPGYFSGEGYSTAFADYFAEGKISFELAGVLDDVIKRRLLVPGKYSVSIAAEFDKSIGWKFFEDDGGTAAEVRIVLMNPQQAEPNNIFYYLPFDGEIGRETGDGRQGYGVDYFITEETLEEGVYLNELTGIESFSDSSNPLVRLSVDKSENLQALNSRLTRGNLLVIVRPEERDEGFMGSLRFSPNKYSGAIMRVRNDTYTEGEIKAAYKMYDAGDVTIDTGENLSFWSALGECRNFSGNWLANEFTDRVDLKDDDLESYALHWTSGKVVGDVYLRSVFYLPIAREGYTLQSKTNNTAFIVRPMEIFEERRMNESAALAPSDELYFTNLSHISKLFDLVGENKVCISNEENETHFWWNQEHVFDSTDLNAFEQRVGSGSWECIE